MFRIVALLVFLMLLLAVAVSAGSITMLGTSVTNINTGSGVGSSNVSWVDFGFPWFIGGNITSFGTITFNQSYANLLFNDTGVCQVVNLSKQENISLNTCGAGDFFSAFNGSNFTCSTPPSGFSWLVNNTFNYYLYNTSNYLTFNDTMLNATIDARAVTGFSWLINNSYNYYLYNTSNFLTFNDSLLNATVSFEAGKYNDTGYVNALNSSLTSVITTQNASTYQSMLLFNDTLFVDALNVSFAHWSLNNTFSYYLYNTSNFITFNDTMLNATINTIGAIWNNTALIQAVNNSHNTTLGGGWRNDTDMTSTSLAVLINTSQQNSFWVQNLTSDLLYVNGSNGHIGFGTAYPAYALDVVTSEAAPTARFRGTDTTYGPQFLLDASGAGGREYRLVSTPSGSPIGGNNFAIYDTAASAYRFIMDANGSGNFSNTNSRLWVNNSEVCTGANSVCSGTSTLNETIKSIGNITGLGTAGFIPLYAATRSLNNSIIAQHGINLTVNGNLNVSGNLNVTTNISINNAGGCLYIPGGGKLCGNATCSILYSPSGLTVMQSCD